MNIGPYRDLQEIGRGGMGVVYKARDSRDGRIVAIKRIQGLASRSQKARLALVQEAGTTAQLRHKNIVTVFDVGQQEGVLFIVMEYLDGNTLNQLMKMGKAFGFSRRLDLVRQVCMALQYAHERGVIHRDIKPGNIFVRHDLSAKVLDFGISALSKVQSQPASPIGTPVYMSPEQIKGREIGPQSDIWSLGVTLFELLRGRLPFLAETRFDLFAQILNVEFPATPLSFPFVEQVERIFTLCLAKNPESRYRSAEAFAQDLERLIPYAKQCERDKPGAIWLNQNESNDRTVDTLDEVSFPAPARGLRIPPASRENPTVEQDVRQPKASDEGQSYTPPNLGLEVTSFKNVQLLVTRNVVDYITLVGVLLAAGISVAPLVYYYLTHHIYVERIAILGKDHDENSAIFIGFMACLLFVIGYKTLADWWTLNPRCPRCRLPMPRRSDWLNYPRSQIEDSFVRSDCIGALQSGAWPEATKLFTILAPKYQLDPNTNPRYQLSFHECARCQRQAAKFAMYGLRIKRNGEDFWVQISPAIVAHASQPDEGEK